jgi:uncharacterized protein (UPF0332 family)
MNGRDFLTFARTLATSGQEAAWRSMVSRAYYAAFHVARERFADLRFTVPRADRAHSYLHMRLQNCGHPQAAAAGVSLDKLRADRNRADYDLHRPIVRNFALSAIHSAEQIVQALDSARIEPARTLIVDGIKVYERTVLGVVTWNP